MSENQSNDNLSKLFQRAQQQAEQSTQPPPMLWERLENKLEARPKRKPLSFLRFAAAASILMTIGMTGLLLMRSQKDKTFAANELQKQPDTIVNIGQRAPVEEENSPAIADASTAGKTQPKPTQPAVFENKQRQVADKKIFAQAPPPPIYDNIAQYEKVVNTEMATAPVREEQRKDKATDYLMKDSEAEKVQENVADNYSPTTPPRPADLHVNGGPASNQAASPQSVGSYPPQREQTTKKEALEPNIDFDDAPGLSVESTAATAKKSQAPSGKNAKRKETASDRTVSKSLNMFSFLDNGADEQGNVSESWERVSNTKLRCAVNYKGKPSKEIIELVDEKGLVYLSLQLKEKGEMERLKLVSQKASRYIFEGEGLRITLVQGKTPTYTWEVQAIKGTLTKEQRVFFEARGFAPNAGFKEQLSRCVNRM